MSIDNHRREIIDKYHADAKAYGAGYAYGEVFSNQRWGIMLNSLIPYHMQAGISEYICFGRETGGFLESFLINDLMGALGKADLENQKRFMEYGTFLHNYAPAGSFGSVEAYQNWIAQGGAVGKPEEVAES